MPKSRSKRRPRRPPPKVKPKQSPEWIGALFFVLLTTGMVTIVGNYLGVFPGGTSNWRLWFGLGQIFAAFIVATRWH
jgi:hypothetical protein